MAVRDRRESLVLDVQAVCVVLLQSAMPLGLGTAVNAALPVLLLTVLAEARVWDPVSVARVYPQPEDDDVLRDRVVLREPVYREPVYRDPVFREPAFRDSGFREPSYRDPALREPVPRDPVVRDLSLREPILRDPVVRDSSLREPILRDPLVRDSGPPVDRVLVTSRDGRATLFERVIPEDIHRQYLPPRVHYERGPDYQNDGPPGERMYQPGDYMYVPAQRSRVYSQ